jgi:hypothetical protein
MWFATSKRSLALLSIIALQATIACAQNARGPLDPKPEPGTTPAAKQSTGQLLEIVNAGFEDTRGGARPHGWVTAQHVGPKLDYRMEHDEKNFSEGKRSFKIERLSEQAYGSVKQIYTLPTGHSFKKLEFSAQLKSDNTDGRGWRLVVNVNTPTIMHVRQYMSEPLLGKKDWQRISVSIPIEKNDSDIMIGAILLDAGIGWIDNVQLRQIE